MTARAHVSRPLEPPSESSSEPESAARLAARRVHDESAYKAARATAAAEMRELQSVLLSGVGVAAVERSAKRVASAVSALWERAARLLE